MRTNRLNIPLQQPRLRLSFLLWAVLFIMPFSLWAENPPQLPLANSYDSSAQADLSEYWVSEKLDGVRAYWDGEKLISRQGNTYHAPVWFTEKFPTRPLDGELWIGRNQFEALMRIVRDQVPTDDWKEVRYMVFDYPHPTLEFSERIEKIAETVSQSDSPYLRAVEQYRVKDHPTLMSALDKVIKQGGEGLMLHKGSARYTAGRSSDLLKVKRYEDAEARVIAHLPGKGKYKGMLGALLVETEEDVRFRIGTGFSDEERRTPPPIGSEVTFKYYGKTVNGVPKFASFLRIRQRP